MWFQKNKWKIVLPVLVIVVLVAAFCFGGDTSSSGGGEVMNENPPISALPEAEDPAASGTVEQEQTNPPLNPMDTTEKEPEPAQAPAETVTKSDQGQVSHRSRAGGKTSAGRAAECDHQHHRLHLYDLYLLRYGSGQYGCPRQC